MLFAKGMAAMDRGLNHDALVNLQGALAEEPEMTRATIALARLYVKMGDEDTAAYYHRNLLEKNPRARKSLKYLYEHHLKNRRFCMAANILEQRINQEKNPKRLPGLYMTLGELYLKGGDFTKARDALLESMNRQPFNAQVLRGLSEAFLHTKDHRRWRFCRQVLHLGGEGHPANDTAALDVFHVGMPLQWDLFRLLEHPKQREFLSLFGWTRPLFRMIEPDTPPEVLRLSRPDENGRVPDIFRRCAGLLSMEPPPLYLYQGEARLTFLADPHESFDKYSFIYNCTFTDKTPDGVLACQLISRLVLLRWDMSALLGLSLSDVSRLLLEFASLLFGILSFLRSFRLDRVAPALDKAGKSKKFAGLLDRFQEKLRGMKLLGKSVDEVKDLAGRALALIPENQLKDNGSGSPPLMNKKLLESLLPGFYHTGDRIALYLTGNLGWTLRSILTGSGQEHEEKVTKAGFFHYVTQSRNNLEKQRCAEILRFAINSPSLTG